MIKGLSPTKAVDVLPHVGKKAAGPLAKVIKAAIANAKDRSISEGDLVFKEIQITEGPRLKRGRSVGRGRWNPYQRPMSHIRVVLTTKEPEAIKQARKEIEARKGGANDSKIKNQISKLQIKNKNEKK